MPLQADMRREEEKTCSLQHVVMPSAHNNLICLVQTQKPKNKIMASSYCLAKYITTSEKNANHKHMLNHLI